MCVEGEMKFLCPVCVKPFKHRFHMKNHVTNVHGSSDDVRMFECSCGKRYKYKPDLTRHQKKSGHDSSIPLFEAGTML